MTFLFIDIELSVLLIKDASYLKERPRSYYICLPWNNSFKTAVLELVRVLIPYRTVLREKMAVAQ